MLQGVKQKKDGLIHGIGGNHSFLPIIQWSGKPVSIEFEVKRRICLDLEFSSFVLTKSFHS
ncbi:hypothetical protein BUQ74_01565 [Leptospira weilii serovar Heyan]|nr:hypothetical protein BUQ74_01565 [Leptospira weilii serovar Heyan]